MSDSPRVRLSVEIDVEVTDPAALTAYAEAEVRAADFGGQPGATPEQERQDTLDRVRSSAAEALLWSCEGLAVADSVPGVEAATSVVGAELVGPGASEALWVASQPPFAELFPPAAADDVWALSPRTALALWAMLTTMADHGYDDVDGHGDDPVDDDSAWTLFGDYPRVTWRQDAVWRRQAARAFDDLAGDLAQGREPLPRSPGEEMALHLALRLLPTAIEDNWWGPDLFDRLPERDGDLNVDTLLDVLFQDHDILALFEAELDGIEDPDDPANAGTGMGDYRPAAWFRPFDSAEPRDGRRPFRR
jgi:hypothetical protein